MCHVSYSTLTQWVLTYTATFLKGSPYGAFTLPDPDSYTDTYEIYKGYTGTDSVGGSYDDLDAK